MQRHQKLGLAALAVFVFSHFLPAYHGESGFACFQVCWSALLDGEELFSGGWFYYSGFVIVNILFPVLVIALFAAKRIRRFTVFVSVVAFLQVLSWGVLNLAAQPTEFSQIQIGYYMWLAAFGGLVAAHFAKAPNEAFGQTPVNHHAPMAHN